MENFTLSFASLPVPLSYTDATHNSHSLSSCSKRHLPTPIRVPKPPLRPPNQLLIHRPRQRRTHRLPRHSQSQSIEESFDAVFAKHQHRRAESILVFGGLELDAGLDGVEGVGEGGGESGGEDGGGGVDCCGGGEEGGCGWGWGWGLGGTRSRCCCWGESSTQSRLSRFVEDYVQSGVGGVANGGGAETGEEAPQAFAADDVAGGVAQGPVGVQVGFVADFDHGHGHQDEAGEDAGGGARYEVLGV